MVTDMRREDRRKVFGTAVQAGAWRRQWLDDILQRDRRRKHTMGKAEFRERLLKELKKKHE